MSRNPGHADRLMLEAAKKIVCEDGCSGLRVRQLVQRAGVNLGMFHYHFQNKRRFKRALLQEMYENFFEKITQASTQTSPQHLGHESGPAILRLRSTLLAIGHFVRQESPFYFALFKDVLNDDVEVLAFMQQNIHRHIGVLSRLVSKCQEEGSMALLPFPQILSFLMTSLNMPFLIGEAMSRHERGRFLKYYQSSVLSDEAIAQRIDLALKGLRV